MGSKKVKFFLWLLILGNILVVSVGVALFFMNKTKKAEITAVMLSIADEEDKVKNLAELKKFADGIVASRNAINSHFIPAKGVVPFIEFVEGLGSNVGVDLKINSADAEPLKKGSNFETIRFRVEATGSQQAILGFMKRLEYAPYSITLGRADLAVLDETAKTWRGVFEFSADKMADK